MNENLSVPTPDDALLLWVEQTLERLTWQEEQPTKLINPEGAEIT